ncbi:MAG: alanine racemase [Peptococcaceae bacterium]|nr:alanine racemase [Peptococcaceae bacterium]
MKKEQLQTPAILVDLDKLENNLRTYHGAAAAHKKRIWPMIKTHKCAEIARLQAELGATGFLAGTLDECEALRDAGCKTIMYAYPTAGPANIARVIALSQTCDFYIRLDGLDGGKMLNEAAGQAGTKIQYAIIVDSGLGRFGVELSQLPTFAAALRELPNLTFKGISTHPGHAYGGGAAGVAAAAADEKNIMGAAADLLRQAGCPPELVTSGSTPTFAAAVDDANINIYHPGNYVFMDATQISLDRAKESDCSLTVLATVISHPKEDIYIIDAGAKCLGLDQGAHGNSAAKGYGKVKGHPELLIYSLSEEVGKLRVEGRTEGNTEGRTDIKVGDRLEIIPNHSCSSANLTSHYIGCRGDRVEKVLTVDIRGNSTTKGAS